MARPRVRLEIVLAAVLPVLFGSLWSRHYFVESTLYWDQELLFSVFHDNLASLNRFGEVAWWTPRNQHGFPLYYFAWLGTDIGSPMFLVAGALVWLLGRLGFIFDSYHAFYISYQFVLMPALYTLSVAAIARHLLHSRAAVLLAVVLATFSTAAMSNLSDTGLEQAIYGNFCAAALLYALWRPSRFRFWVLVFTLAVLALALRHVSLYGNVFFVPLFAAAVLLSRRKRAGLRRLFRAVLLRDALAAAVLVALCLVPTALVFSHGGEIVRSTTGTRTYHFDHLMPGHPGVLLSISTPGIIFEWDKPEEVDKKFVPAAIGGEAPHGLYVYLGALGLPLVFLGLAYSRSRFRLPLLAMLGGWVLVILLSTHSAVFALVLVWPSPLRAVNHYSDHLYVFSTLALLAAALGLDTLLHGGARKRLPLMTVFLFFSAASMAWHLWIHGKSAPASHIFGFAAATIFFVAAALKGLASAPTRRAALAATGVVLGLTFVDVSTMAWEYVRVVGWATSGPTDFRGRAGGIGLEPEMANYYADTVLQLISVRRASEGDFDPNGLPILALYPASLPLTAEVGMREPLPVKIDILSQTYNSLGVRLKSPEQARLFWRNARFPFWRATVNGKPAPIETAYGAYMSVPVAAGESEVALSFRPGPVAWAIPLCATLVFALGVALVIAKARPAASKTESASEPQRYASE